MRLLPLRFAGLVVGPRFWNPGPINPYTDPSESASAVDLWKATSSDPEEAAAATVVSFFIVPPTSPRLRGPPLPRLSCCRGLELRWWALDCGLALATLGCPPLRRRCSSHTSPERRRWRQGCGCISSPMPSALRPHRLDKGTFTLAIQTALLALVPNLAIDVGDAVRACPSPGTWCGWCHGACRPGDRVHAPNC